MALEIQTNGGAKLPSRGTQIYLDPEITETYKSQDSKKSWFRTGVSGGVGKRAHKTAMHKLVHINRRVVIKETYNPSSKLHQGHKSMARDVAQWVTLVQVPRTCGKADLGTCVSVSSVMGSGQRWLAGRQSRSRFSKSLSQQNEVEGARARHLLSYGIPVRAHSHMDLHTNVYTARMHEVLGVTGGK